MPFDIIGDVHGQFDKLVALPSTWGIPTTVCHRMWQRAKREIESE
jgi:hypothetical protein